MVTATTASKQQTHRQKAAKQAAPEAAAALPVAVPHAGNTSKQHTCSSTPSTKLQYALPELTRHTDVAHHQGNLGEQAGLVQDEQTSPDGAQAASTSTASSSKAALHDAAASCSKSALFGGEEPEVQQHGCTSSRGAVPGRVTPADDEQNGCTRCGWYKSAARVVLLGQGADEQHAGYGRHRTSFRNQVR